MASISVDLEWLLQIRDLLYRISVEDSYNNGITAEILGSHIPDYIKETENVNKDEFEQS